MDRPPEYDSGDHADQRPRGMQGFGDVGPQTGEGGAPRRQGRGERGEGESAVYYDESRTPSDQQTQY